MLSIEYIAVIFMTITVTTSLLLVMKKNQINSHKVDIRINQKGGL